MIRLIVIFAVLLSMYALFCGALRCHDCYGDNCTNLNGCETSGKCFIRVDPNGAVYRGCANENSWWRLKVNYTGCKDQKAGGWSIDGEFKMVEWCFCDKEDNCNGVDIEELRKGNGVNLEYVAGPFPGLTEGPVFDRHGFLYVTNIGPVDMRDGSIHKVDVLSKTSQIFASPVIDGYHSVPNGLALDQEGILWLADVWLGLLRLTPSGEYTRVATHDSFGNALKGMNDLTFDYHGNLWITAPYNKLPNTDNYASLLSLVDGSIYCRSQSGEIIHVDDGYHFPNGIAVQHDNDGTPRLLIVTEMLTKKLWAYDITGSCQITNKRLWGVIPGWPNGIDFDQHNNLLVTAYKGGAIYVFGPEGGDYFTRLDMPFADVTNVEFQPYRNTVYVTEGSKNSVWKFEWKYNGKIPYGLQQA